MMDQIAYFIGYAVLILGGGLPLTINTTKGYKHGSHRT